MTHDQLSIHCWQQIHNAANEQLKILLDTLKICQNDIAQYQVVLEKELRNESSEKLKQRQEERANSLSNPNELGDYYISLLDLEKTNAMQYTTAQIENVIVTINNAIIEGTEEEMDTASSCCVLVSELLTTLESVAINLRKTCKLDDVLYTVLLLEATKDMRVRHTQTMERLVSKNKSASGKYFKRRERAIAYMESTVD
mgnify:CR=1 FL=1